MASYPTSRTHYCRTVGDLREKRVLQVLKAIVPSTYQVTSHSDISVNGADISIFHKGKPIAKFEVINENGPSYIDSKRALSIRKNLKGVKFKGLICSHGNLTREAKKILKNIPIHTLGFQTLPKPFHDYYSKINKVFKRKIANGNSLKLLKNSILSFLFKIGFIKHMYVSDNKYGMESNISTLLPTVTSSVFFLICDGGSGVILPCGSSSCSHAPCNSGNKNCPFFGVKVKDLGFPLKEVSFHKKGEDYDIFDCLQCNSYRICNKRICLSYLSCEFKKTFDEFKQAWNFKPNLLLYMDRHFLEKELERQQRQRHERLRKLRDEKVRLLKRMFKCLKRRNYLHGKTIKGNTYDYFGE